MITIEISDDVWNEMVKVGKFGDTADDVLRKVFKLELASNLKFKQPSIKRKLPPDGTKCKMMYKGTQYNGSIRGDSVIVENKGTGSSLSSASYLISKNYRNGWRDWWFLLPGTTEWVHAHVWRSKNR